MSEEQMPPLISVDSSNILGISYDARSEFLYVQFKNKAGQPSGLYRYAQVPVDVYRGIMNSYSKGKFFAAQIKSQYPSAKLS